MASSEPSGILDLEMKVQPSEPDSTARTRADQTLARYAKRLEILQEIDRAILAARSPEATAQAAMRHIRQLVPCLRASVSVFDFEHGEAVVYAIQARGETELGMGVRLPQEAFGSMDALRQGQVRTVEDLRSLPDAPFVDSLRAAGLRSWINVPLISHGELIGTLNIGSDHPGTLASEHITIAREVADTLAIAIGQAHLHETVRRSEERHRVLLEINNAIVANLDRKSLFDAITGALRRVVPFDLAGLTLYDRVKDTLQIYALAGMSPSHQFLQVGTEFPRQGSHLATIFESKRPLIRRDLETAQRIGAEDELLKEGVRSYVAVPLIATTGAPVGSLNIASRAPDRYSETDAEFLTDVGRQVALAIQNMLAYEEITALKVRLEQESVYLQEEIDIQYNFTEIIGKSSAIRNVLETIETVAATDVNVVITGETGTGKELVARAVHNLSSRKHTTLIKVNCASIPRELFESEFFGHAKGAFTGALRDRAGRFQLADNGTLFLDEVAEIPVDMQAKLLRVLQEGEYERVGEERTRKVNVRIIAATNRDLKQEVDAGRFRQDLYYRLNVFPIDVPPLRRRREDIPPLASHFLKQAAAKLKRPRPALTQRDALQLQNYDWPGNVRELQNVIERAMVTARSGVLQFTSPLGKLHTRLPDSSSAPAALGTDVGIVLEAEMRARERENILAALRRANGRISGPQGAAELLGVNPSTLASRIKKLGLRSSG